jgi:hypothetical protein
MYTLGNPLIAVTMLQLLSYFIAQTGGDVPQTS